jgi:ABC-type polysaccharide/polyol phosphate export permease
MKAIAGFLLAVMVFLIVYTWYTTGFSLYTIIYLFVLPVYIFIYVWVSKVLSEPDHSKADPSKEA